MTIERVASASARHGGSELRRIDYLDGWRGLAIFLVSLGFNLLGDGLRDVLDPRSAGK